MEYRRYRVKSPVKSFRDLEVYQKTLQLSNQFTSLNYLSDQELNEIKIITEKIPILIAESYGDKYDSDQLAYDKLTEVVRLITNAIARTDLLREKFKKGKEKEQLDKLLTNYKTQKRKVLNLRKAWKRVYSKRNFNGKKKQDKSSRSKPKKD